MPDAVLHIPAERRNLATVREFIAKQARAASAPPDKVDDLVQAVDELVTNMIVHGYRDGPGQIEVVFTKQSDSITVILRDRAPHFDSTRTPMPDIHLGLEKRSPGGLGLYLVRQCVDQFEHQARAGGGNELKIVIRLGSESAKTGD